MGATWFDNLRGIAQGRVEPASVSPKEGTKVFVLGGDEISEPAVISPGDFTEVRQVVDLTNWDFVLANLDTVGKAIAQYQPPCGWADTVNDLWHFNYNEVGLGGENLVSGGFDVAAAGDLTVGAESYSPSQTPCRVIPVGSTTAQMVGVNTPNWIAPSPLNEYTFQCWLNFDSEAHSGSSGIDPIIFGCNDLNNGFAVQLGGFFGPGAHQWNIGVMHRLGGSSQSTTFPFAVIDLNLGWVLMTITYDVLEPVLQRLKLYIDDSPIPFDQFSSMSNGPGAPPPGTAIEIAHPDLWGSIDEMRMLDRILSPAEIAASYAESTVLPPAVDMAWEMQILIDDSVYGERVIAPTEQRRWTDFKAPTRHLLGEHEVAFRLALQEA